MRLQCGAWRQREDRDGEGELRGRGSGDVPDIDFNRILAKLVRYFHQPKEYWLDQEHAPRLARNLCRELREAPPAEAFLAGYFGYEPPGDGADESAEEVAVPGLEDSDPMFVARDPQVRDRASRSRPDGARARSSSR
jgi:hypothetical protein